MQSVHILEMNRKDLLEEVEMEQERYLSQIQQFKDISSTTTAAAAAAATSDDITSSSSFQQQQQSKDR